MAHASSALALPRNHLHSSSLQVARLLESHPCAVSQSPHPTTTIVSSPLQQSVTRFRSPSIVEDVTLSVEDSEMIQVVELELNNDASSEIWKWNEEDIMPH
ncbi:hypothetical protein DEO72_LG6g844 [Vigna unguiculata]|uniref:Uncharacterized protein n=1 Tax=Vigna unguiculata TaxID=3917 RepID=A0A4D6M4G1_VIGUN|nr:hypothetical protein DEO72_LG6g844 [Vigna unguiculata]